MTSGRDWPAIFSLGFCVDGNGRRRKPVWTNIVILGILLPGFASWGLYRAFTTHTGAGLWALAAALYLFTMFGVTLGHHRYWTHRGLEFRADDSRNNAFVAVVADGEGNHSWHHADPACPRHGRRVVLDAAAVAAGVRPDRGWRPDATWRLIQLLALPGLIYKVKTPKARVSFAGKQLVPTPSLRRTHREWQIGERRDPEERDPQELVSP